MIKCAMEPAYAAMRTVETIFRESSPPKKAVLEDNRGKSADGEQIPLLDDFTASQPTIQVVSRPHKRQSSPQDFGEQINLFEEEEV